MVNVPSTSLIGRKLGQYRIVEQLGAGGMGVVYRARDEQLERDVAVKLLPAGLLADETARKRFRREALALSKLNHANIATVYAFGNEGGVDYLAMELIPGTALSDKLTGGALPEKEVLQLGAQITAALEEAHAQGVNHRDLKPGNIVVTPRGVAKVLDFGLAQFFRPEGASAADGTAGGVATESISLTKGVVGTPAYMSPEQLRGDAADARTDLYALGCVLYEMATGQRVYREDQPTRLIEAILHRPPVAPRARNERVSPELERIILKCLEKDPDRRYQSAKEVGVDLRRLAEPSTVSAMEETAGRKRRWWGSGAVAAVVLVLVVLAGLFFVRFPGARFPWFGRAPSGHIESLVVLPLENLSHDQAQDYFADGMTEELITHLGQISVLRVISRTSALRYKGTTKTLPQIAQELHVDAVVEGAVLRSGDRVRITAHLIDAANDREIWAKHYEGELRDVLSLQNQVANAIAHEIRAKLTPEENIRLGSVRSVNPEAFEAYLKGRYFWRQFTAAGTEKSVEQFQRAIQIDPKYGAAYAGLAGAYALGSVGGGRIPPRESMPKAREAAQKALDLDGTLSDAHLALALVQAFYDWEWHEAGEGFRRAIELNPNNAEAHHWYSHYYVAQGQMDESLAESKRALELDPLSPDLTWHLGWHYYLARQYDKSVGQLRKTFDLDPNSLQAHSMLGLAYEAKGMFSESVGEFQQVLSLSSGNPYVLHCLAHVYAISGRRDQALTILAQLKELSKRRYISGYNLAAVYAGLGEKNQALDWLEKAYEEHALGLSWFKVDPRLDSLRSNPRFVALLHRVGLPE